MDNAQHAKLQEIIDNGYQFNFGDYISKGFSIFGKYIGGFMGFGLLAGIILTVAAFIPFLGQLASTILTPALTVGVYIVAHRINKGEQPEFGDFFKDLIVHIEKERQAWGKCINR